MSSLWVGSLSQFFRHRTTVVSLTMQVLCFALTLTCCAPSKCCPAGQRSERKSSVYKCPSHCPAARAAQVHLPRWLRTIRAQLRLCPGLKSSRTSTLNRKEKQLD